MIIHSMGTGTAKCFGQNIEDSAPSVVCCGRTILGKSPAPCIYLWTWATGAPRPADVSLRTDQHGPGCAAQAQTAGLFGVWISWLFSLKGRPPLHLHWPAHALLLGC
jgi:hypothetical protein